MLPSPLFDVSYATILKDKKSNILAGSIAKDGQWRFPQGDSIPVKFEKAILAFEDEYFYEHIGVNPVSIAKAFWTNLTSGEIKRGGSTLTMQLARLQQGNRSRTYLQKLKETLLALRVECSFSKREILQFYAAHAPFGGNVVGLESASRRYYGVPSYKLNWSEMATLAVLPNQPGLIYPGANQESLRKKRNRLLKKLLKHNTIDSLTYEMSIAEPLPQKPYSLPRLGAHLLERLKLEKGHGKDYISTIDGSLQKRCVQLLEHRMDLYRGNKVHNGAILVLNNQTGEVLSYVGNALSKGHGEDVDIITAKRSTGSLLKPFLYASMMNDGLLLPNELVQDIPVYYKGFHPQNYNKSYQGVISASDALARSLNVPAVILLDKYNLQRFKRRLNDLGMYSIDKPASHYGLSLILGGSESSLFEMAGAYSSLARVLNNYDQGEIYRYSSSDYFAPNFLPHQQNRKHVELNGLIDAASIWFTFQAMAKVYRPDDEVGWEAFNSSSKIAWKTGTSYGHRDGWAIGVTPKYTVGVWVGNADGEGRPGLTGANYAAPIMFDVFNYLPRLRFWDEFPYDEAELIPICNTTGKIATHNCITIDTTYVPSNGAQKGGNCLYHQTILVDHKGKRVNRTCSNDFTNEKVFVLPTIEAYYYKQKHLTYNGMPSWATNCAPDLLKSPMKLIYPKKGTSIIIPKELSGLQGSAVFYLAHSYSERLVYWYLDEKLLGVTQGSHRLSVQEPEGNYLLRVIDETGETVEQYVRIKAGN
ncbi:penicillin-binding protein 1C [Cyclobacteriaceae bacterium]|nr:penicillin-binding protein 1C [Cyclobacteriaceae bacterium]